MIVFDREKYFNSVRGPLFNGKMEQGQVTGQDAILAAWEETRSDQDLRWLAYELATAKHETASTMQPIEEYGKGKGRAYGVPDPETGETYYGRGYVQLTWKENYVKMSHVTGDDLVHHPEAALLPSVAAEIMFHGMENGSFRPGHDLVRYFGIIADDPYNARDIINGDKKVVPKWSNGVSIGNLVAGYYASFLRALKLSRQAASEVEPKPEPLVVRVIVPQGITVEVETLA